MKNRKRNYTLNQKCLVPEQDREMGFLVVCCLLTIHVPCGYPSGSTSSTPTVSVLVLVPWTLLLSVPELSALLSQQQSRSVLGLLCGPRCCPSGASFSLRAFLSFFANIPLAILFE